MSSPGFRLEFSLEQIFDLESDLKLHWNLVRNLDLDLDLNLGWFVNYRSALTKLWLGV